MTRIAMLLGLKDKPACEPCLEKERAKKLARLEALLFEIAEKA